MLVVGLHSVSLRPRGDVEGDDLDITRSGCGVLKRAGIEKRPVGDGGFERADVD